MTAEYQSNNPRRADGEPNPRVISFVRNGLFAAITAACAASVRGESTHGAWISGAFSGALDTNNVFSAQLSEENRFGEKNLEEVHAVIGLGIKPFDWLSLTPHYHSVHVRKNATGYAKASGHHLNHRWEREDRTGIDVTPSYELRGWKFSDRNRVVWRNYEDSRGFWRYRNRMEQMVREVAGNIPSLEIKAVNLDEPANEHYVADFGLTMRTVVLRDGVRFAVLDKCWTLAHDEAAFKDYVAKSIADFAAAKE